MRAYRRDVDGVWIVELVDGAQREQRPLAPRHASEREVAMAVLQVELAVPPSTLLAERFEAFVRGEFLVTAAAVWDWIRDHRELVDAELFLTPPEGTALAVTDEGRPSTEAVIDDATGSAVVAACEAAWRDIASHHPELPDAVIVLGSGVERGRLVKLGHWWGGRWVADGAVRGEVLLAGEALHLQPEQVFEVLLHEAAHGINAARGVKDTSRGGRYHNQRFAATAREVLLRVRSMAPYGLASTSLTPQATERYAASIDRLAGAMRIARQLDSARPEQGDGKDGSTPEGGSGSGRSVAAACGCGRRLRIAPGTLAAGPIICGRCETEFEPGRATRSETAHSPVVDHSFVERRARALDAEGTRQVDRSDAARLERQRERLAAILAEAPGSALGLDLLAERLHRVHDLVGAAVRHPSATPEQRQGLARLLDESAEQHDLDSLRQWYERYGTPDEQPMPAVDERERSRRERLARALLRADGTLRGPEVEADGRAFAAGDRVVAGPQRLSGGPPEGVPGTVEAVDADAGAVHIDFATWGRVRARLAGLVDDAVRHDYTAPPQPPAPTVELDRFTPEVEL